MNYFEYFRYNCEVEVLIKYYFFYFCILNVCKELYILLKFIIGNLEDDFRLNEFFIVFRDRFFGGMLVFLLLCVLWLVLIFFYQKLENFGIKL